MSTIDQGCTVILLAGGKGLRMNKPVPKQYLPIQKKLIAQWSFDLFVSCKDISELVVVCAKEYQSLFKTDQNTVISFAEPGKRRQDSFFNGLQAMQIKNEFICVHDAARPLLTHELLTMVMTDAKLYGAAVLGVPVKHTVKESDDFGFVKKTLARDAIWEIQTPQIAKKVLFEEAFRKIIDEDITVTDDMSMIELIGHPVKLVKSSYSNIKVTTEEDLLIAEMFLSQDG